VGVKAKTVGSLGAFKSMLAKGASAGALTRINDKADLKVRFLEEPDCWIQYTEHFIQGTGFFPCNDDGTCIGCSEGNKGSKRFLVNAVDMEERKVIALVVPFTLANDLGKLYDRFNTLLDRQYDLGRTGTGKNDTEYSAFHNEPKRFNAGHFELLDLMKVLDSQLPKDNENYVDDEDDEEPQDAKPVQRRAVEDDEDFAAKPARPIAKAAPPKAAPLKRAATPAQPAPAPAKKLLRRPGA
jgi:hypothetical protein